MGASHSFLVLLLLLLLEELERWEGPTGGGVTVRSKPSLTVVTGVCDNGGLGVLLAEEPNDLQCKDKTDGAASAPLRVVCTSLGGC